MTEQFGLPLEPICQKEIGIGFSRERKKKKKELLSLGVEESLEVRWEDLLVALGRMKMVDERNKLVPKLPRQHFSQLEFVEMAGIQC